MFKFSYDVPFYLKGAIWNNNNNKNKRTQETNIFSSILWFYVQQTKQCGMGKLNGQGYAIYASVKIVK